MAKKYRRVSSRFCRHIIIFKHNRSGSRKQKIFVDLETGYITPKQIIDAIHEGYNDNKLSEKYENIFTCAEIKNVYHKGIKNGFEYVEIKNEA